MRNPVAPGQPTPTGTNAYAPSVPISVYRELAAELQATRAMLDTINAQNQHLQSQNQQLRLEIEKVVQAALQMRQAAESLPSSSMTPPSMAYPSVGLGTELHPALNQVQHPVHKTAPANPRNFAPAPELADLPLVEPDRVLTQAATHPSTHKGTVSSKDVNGWWLAGIILLIIISAFGAGFLIVRPFLPSR